MINTTANVGNKAEHDTDASLGQKPSHEPIQDGSEIDNIEHVKEKGLPPGVEPDDLFNPNGDRPRGVPNGDNS